MMPPLASLPEGVPHDRHDASDPPRGPLALGVGGGTQAPGGCAHRYLLLAAPRQCPLVWPWGRGAALGDSRWPSYALQGGNAIGGTRHVAPPSALPHLHGAE